MIHKSIRNRFWLTYAYRSSIVRKFRSQELEKEFRLESIKQSTKAVTIFGIGVGISLMLIAVTDLMLSYAWIPWYASAAKAVVGLIVFGWVYFVRSVKNITTCIYDLLLATTNVIMIVMLSVIESISRRDGDPGFMSTALTAYCYVQTISVFSFVRSSITAGIYASVVGLAGWLLCMRLNGFSDYISITRLCTFWGMSLMLGCFLYVLNVRKDRYIFLQQKRLAKTATLQRKIIKAKKDDIAKTRFLSTLSHEIRTPMNGIENLVSLMKLRGTLDYSNPRDSILLEGLQTSSARLLNTLNDMLDFAQGGHQTQGALLLKTSTFSLHKLTADLGAVFTPLADKKSIAFTTQLAGNVECWLCGDEEKIYRLLSNLIANALKFTPTNGSITFSVANQITTTQERKAVANCHFVVSDTGIGLAATHLHKIFEPFYQVDQGDSRQYQGNGLGLAICQQIAEAVGGRIWVESELGQGAQFHFTVTLPTVVV